MLKLKQINKEYKTGELVQHALNNVSLNLRDNEFVAILGPSGSGKTTRHLHKKIHRPRLGLLPEPHHRLCVPEL